MREFQVYDWRIASGGRYGTHEIYDKFLEAQDYIWEERLLKLIPDTLIITYHPPTITINQYNLEEGLQHIRPLPREWFQGAESYDEQGRANLFQKAKEFLAAKYGIRLVSVNRGGKVWYHDEGVLQLYVIAELESGFPSEIVNPLVETLCQTLQTFSMPVECIINRPGEMLERERHGFIGVWVNSKKIGAIGVRIEGPRRITKFGAALNVNPSMKNFALIDPCGLPGKEATSMQIEYGRPDPPITHDWVLSVLYPRFEAIFQTKLPRTTAENFG